MGIRLAMKKELMGLDNSDMLTADDVRAHLANSVKTHKEQDERGFSVISKFNDTHSRLISGDVLEFDGELFQLTLSEDATPVERPVATTQPQPEKTPNETAQKPAKNKRKRTKKPKVDENTGRRPISFG